MRRNPAPFINDEEREKAKSSAFALPSRGANIGLIPRALGAGASIALTIFFVGGAGMATWYASASAAPTEEELRTQIAELEKTVAELSKKLESIAVERGATGQQTNDIFLRNLAEGDTGDDVRALQTVLNVDPRTEVAAGGPGSRGKETTTFGPLTKHAVKRFQELYASDVLLPLGLSSGTGYVGASTRKKLNALVRAALAERAKHKTIEV